APAHSNVSTPLQAAHALPANFPQLTRQALNVVAKHSSAPLWAPTVVPAAANSSWVVSATAVKASSSVSPPAPGYQIAFWETLQDLPINGINQLSTQQMRMSHILGGFDGYQEKNSTQAGQALANYEDAVAFRWNNHSAGTISLNNKVKAKLYRIPTAADNPNEMVDMSWDDGPWMVAVEHGSAPDNSGELSIDTKMANRLIAALSAYSLPTPTTQGFVVVSMVGTPGQPGYFCQTTVKWNQGEDIYKTFAETPSPHNISTAVEMAATMTTVPQ
ncbi:MAG: hypothetical protein OWS74_08220, partial [Firmicutes bacterium]|nr:hypothetical protein [Bacillota bacterium]